MLRMGIVDGRVVPQEDGNIYVYSAPDEGERRYLIEDCGIYEHTLISALDPFELSRLEIEDDYVAIIFKKPKSYRPEDRLTFRVASTGIFLFRDKMIVVMAEELPIFQSKLYVRIKSLQDLALKIIYSSVVHFVEHLRAINVLCDELEDQINSSTNNKYLLNLFCLEKSLVYYLGATNTNAKLIERMRLNASKVGLGDEEAQFMLDDLSIENDQCCRQAEIHSNILASMMDARASIVANNLNWLMKTLTIITIAIMLPTLVVSVFSMNVRFPGQDQPWMFWFVMAMAMMSVGVVRLVWWWKKW